MLPTRRHEISRLEAFSDAVFGFALALLVVSADPPGSYAELVDRMLGVVSFACCCALPVWIWYEHTAHFTYGRRSAWRRQRIEETLAGDPAAAMPVA